MPSPFQLENPQRERLKPTQTDTQSDGNKSNYKLPYFLYGFQILLKFRYKEAE
jgi:hypothetical protein